MKKTIIATLLGAISLTASALPRTSAEVIGLVQDFVGQMPRSAKARLSVATPSQRRVRSSVSVLSDAPAYYIVNIGENDGFVVVSGDDSFKPILGYADQGHIEAGDVLPDGLQYWLNFLSEEMASAKANGYEAQPATRATQQTDYSASVAPLLTTKWNQGTPYNNLIPNFATGCVATGMAQVMRYWKYPTKGIGSHTNGYMSQYSADFGTTTYDWAHMKDVYGGKTDTREEVTAVATLMYHLGVATDMRWTKDQSATANMYAGHALIKFFGYNKNLYAENRDYLSLGAWKALILQQLYSGHPLCYAGMTSAKSNEGHFFVLDGYDASTGLFHFNWGWGGAYDGFFDISALEPGGAGQLGALTGSYNYYQQAFINVQPTETGDYVAHFDAETVVPKKNTCSKNSVGFYASHLTNNALMFTGSIGMAVYNADGTLHTYVPSPQVFPGNLNVGASYSDGLDVTTDLSDLADGTYTVCVAVLHTDHLDSPYPVRAYYGYPTYYTMTVSGNTVSFAEQKSDFYIEDLAKPVIVNALAPNTLYQNVVSTFQVTLKNTGTTVFNDEAGICIQKGNRDGGRQYITVPCTLLPGEEKTITLSGKVLREPGNYNILACYGDNGDYAVLSMAQEVVIEDEANALHTLTSDGGADASFVYNLQGARVPASRLSNGIYILRGKKVLRRD